MINQSIYYNAQISKKYTSLYLSIQLYIFTYLSIYFQGAGRHQALLNLFIYLILYIYLAIYYILSIYFQGAGRHGVLPDRLDSCITARTPSSIGSTTTIQEYYRIYKNILNLHIYTFIFAYRFYISVCMSICLSVYLSVWLSVSVCVCLLIKQWYSQLMFWIGADSLIGQPGSTGSPCNTYQR